MTSAPIGISLNFDSLNEAYGFPAGFRDVSFFEGFDRLAKIAADYNFPLSIYIVGRDLEHPEHAARVKDWADQGHEIGNHSWSHPFNLGSLSEREIAEEVGRSHDKIAEVTGREPRGFIAPVWSTSRQLQGLLIKHGYLYDTSNFPSPLIYPMLLKIALNHRNDLSRMWRTVSRKDWLYFFTTPRYPYIVGENGSRVSYNCENKLLVLPLPTTRITRLAIWHTIGFLFGWDFLWSQVEKLTKEHPSYYHLIHPADFLGEEDLDNSQSQSLERMEMPLDSKLKNLQHAFELLQKANRPIVTMETLALFHLQQMKLAQESRSGSRRKILT